MVLTYLVLLSERTRSWKITDFGLTSEGTSRRAYTTRYGRGTDCYRAPELMSDHTIVSMKSDIWALGCIIFELVSGAKAFQNDFHVFQFASNLRKVDDLVFPEFVDPLFKSLVNLLQIHTLDKEWHWRPTSRDVVQCLRTLTRPPCTVYTMHPYLAKGFEPGEVVLEKIDKRWPSVNWGYRW